LRLANLANLAVATVLLATGSLAAQTAAKSTAHHKSSVHKKSGTHVAAKSTTPKPATAATTTSKAATSKATTSKTPVSKTGVSKTGTSKLKSKKPVAAVPRRSNQLQPTPDRYREIQQSLSDKGYFAGQPDGNWGPDSIDALKRFQRDQNLTEDGKIGSLSLIALGLGPRRGVPSDTVVAADAASSSEKLSEKQFDRPAH
jgi:peptidoglycan hydrolase-like protein with peptidoglycan-binding domain